MRLPSSMLQIDPRADGAPPLDGAVQGYGPAAATSLRSRPGQEEGRRALTRPRRLEVRARLEGAKPPGSPAPPVAG